MHLVGCPYYLYQWCTVKQISDNEIYLLIKYIKSVLWRVAKRLSYIEDATCPKVKTILVSNTGFSLVGLATQSPIRNDASLPDRYSAVNAAYPGACCYTVKSLTCA